jgi:integrase
MASLWKHPESRYWVACFTDTDGRRRKRSTKTTDRKLAQKLADQFEEATRRKRTSRQVREILTELHEQITGEALPNVTVRDFITSWIGRKKHEVASSTLVFYTLATGKFLKYLGADAGLPMAEITREHVTRFRNAEAEHLSPKTANHELKCLRMLFKAAKRDGLLSEDPTEFVETVHRGATVQRRPFTVPELQTVLDAANEEWRSMILFGLYTGQRLGDIATLTWENVDLQRDEIRLVTRKTNRTLILPIAPPLRAHLEKLPIGDNPRAPLHQRASEVVLREGKTGSLSNQFADLLAAAGLREKKSHKKSVAGVSARREKTTLSFHSLRRTATTLLHEAGIPPAVAQELIGHDSEEIHQVYVKVGQEALKKAAAALPVLH